MVLTHHLSDNPNGSNPAGVEIVFGGFESLDGDGLADVGREFNKDWVVVGGEKKLVPRSRKLLREGWNTISLP